MVSLTYKALFPPDQFPHFHGTCDVCQGEIAKMAHSHWTYLGDGYDTVVYRTREERIVWVESSTGVVCGRCHREAVAEGAGI